MGRRGRIPYTYVPPVEEYYHNSPFELSIKESSITEAGKGVWSVGAIPAETRIDQYTGDIMTAGYAGSYYVQISDDYGINAQGFPRCYMAMINDSYGSEYQNNCEIRIVDNQVEIWTIRDIQPGEELFMSYGDYYWR